MAISDDYIRQLRKKENKGRISGADVRNILFRYLDFLPEDLSWDIYNLFFPNIEDDDIIETENAENAAAVIDLIEGEYENDIPALTDKQLEYLSEGFNDYALDLSDEVLMNVMKAAVARGLMG